MKYQRLARLISRYSLGYYNAEKAKRFLEDYGNGVSNASELIVAWASQYKTDLKNAMKLFLQDAIKNRHVLTGQA